MLVTSVTNIPKCRAHSTLGRYSAVFMPVIVCISHNAKVTDAFGKD